MQEARSRQGGFGRNSQMNAMEWPETPSTPYTLFPPQHRSGNSASHPSPALAGPVPPAPPLTSHSAPSGGRGRTITETGARAQPEPDNEPWPTFAQYNTTPPLDAPTESSGKSGPRSGKRSKRRKGSLRSLIDGDQERRSRLAQVSMRALHVLSHMALCVVVLYVMFMFLAMPAVTTTRNQRLKQIFNERNNLNRKEAFGLVTVLSVDVLLDLYGLWMCRSEWSRPALVARLVVGGGYIAMFVVYYALGGRVFPLQFTFFGMRPGFAAPFVYLFMWTLGTWNVLWVVMYRHQLRRGRGRRGDGSGETGLSGSGFRSQGTGALHTRKESARSNASSAGRLPGTFGNKGYLDDDYEGTIRVTAEREYRGPRAPPPGYLDSIRLSQWRKDRNNWGDGVGDGADARHESVYLQTARRS